MRATGGKRAETAQTEVLQHPGLDQRSLGHLLPYPAVIEQNFELLGGNQLLLELADDPHYRIETEHDVYAGGETRAGVFAPRRIVSPVEQESLQRFELFGAGLSLAQAGVGGHGGPIPASLDELVQPVDHKAWPKEAHGWSHLDFALHHARMCRCRKVHLEMEMLTRRVAERERAGDARDYA